jgi:3',5'-cyclic-AMP phosphodiesterase
MLIAQITDIHLGFEVDNPGEFNRKRFDQLLQHLHDGPNRPDVLLITGDLVDRGDAESYARFAEAISTCAFPVHMALGNHDQRDNFWAQFPHVPNAAGFVQYAVDLPGFRVLVVDTLEEGRHGGAFCAVRAAWLKAKLAEAPDVPTIIAMHHPPVELGIEWMNTDNKEPWVARFAAAIEGADQVKAILCGHVHRPIVTVWRGKTVAVSASSAPQVALNLCAIDPEHPDNRAMIVAEPPSCAFHRWNGRDLITHFDTAEVSPTLARYDTSLQPLVRELLSERPAKSHFKADVIEFKPPVRSNKMADEPYFRSATHA